VRLGSRVPHRYCLRPSHRYSLADAPAGTRVRVGDDVVASLARLATGGRVGSDPLWAPGLARARRPRLIGRGRSWTVGCIHAVYGGDQAGPNPTDRAKRGSKRHLICDGRGVPLAVRLTGANRNDSQEALASVDAIPPLHGERGRPRQRPDCVRGDRGDDAAGIRRGLRTRHIVPLLAIRRTAHGVAWAGGGGSWSAHLPSSISFATCACGMTSGPTSTRRSSRSGAR
jgi:hypothetical protein